MLDKHDIILKTRKKLFSQFHGEHTSIFGGNGLEFSEVREYNIDDDVRHINWKITARSGTPSVNVFNEHKQLNIALVYFNSGSLYFGSKRAKKDVAVEIMTALSYVVTIKKDTLTSIYYDNKERYFFKPTRDKSIVEINYDTSNDLEPLNTKIDYKALEEYLLNKLKKKSIIFLIGDFLEMPDLKLLGNKHEVYISIIRDRAEEDLNILGEFEFVDTDTLNSREMILDKKSIEAYNKKMQEFDKELFKNLKNSNIKYEKIYTDDDVLQKLEHLTRS